jgi:hypothetical protein
VNVSKAELEGAFADELALLAADGRLHAVGEGTDSSRLGTATGGSKGPDRGTGEARQGHPASSVRRLERRKTDCFDGESSCKLADPLSGGSWPNPFTALRIE